jgi:hypothetical protein
MVKEEVSLNLDRPEEIGQRLSQAGTRLGREESVPESLRREILELAAAVWPIPDSRLAEMDPYFVVALQQGAISCLVGIETEDPTTKRRLVRLGLEQMRQAVRDLAEGLPVREDRPAKDIAQWLDETLDVPQATLAELVGANPRTFQRWVSLKDSAEPRGDEARKLRVVARIANNLRHSLSGPGVVGWFLRPNPHLKGAPPADLLGEPEAGEELLRLAAAVRSSAAS